MILFLAGCGTPSRGSDFSPRAESGHPSFLARVHDDCLAGQRWACEMLNSLSSALREKEER